jgi:hypothetical protein
MAGEQVVQPLDHLGPAVGGGGVEHGPEVTAEPAKGGEIARADAIGHPGTRGQELPQAVDRGQRVVGVVRVGRRPHQDHRVQRVTIKVHLRSLRIRAIVSGP